MNQRNEWTPAGAGEKPVAMRMNRWQWLLLALLGILLIGCGGPGDPGPVVERYLQAKVTGDKAALGALLCTAMEADLERETLTFSGVSGVEIREMSCSQVGNENAVKCNGAIVALYGQEENVFPLTTYRVVEEDGEWKWCGESN